MRRRGQLAADLRRAAGDEAQVFRAEGGAVLLQKRQGVRLALDGPDAAARSLQRHLDGDRAGARAHVPADGVRRQLQLGQADAAHLALGHGHDVAGGEASLKALVRQAVGDEGDGFSSRATLSLSNVRSASSAAVPRVMRSSG